MDIIKSLEWRYACKKFDPKKKIAKEKIDILKKAFNLTPTSFGLQPIKMLILTDQKRKNEIFKYSYNQLQVSTCSHLLVICINTKVDEAFIDEMFDLEKKIRNLDEKAVEGFRKEVKSMYANRSPEEIEQSSINQAYIALGNLMTVCAVENIDSCPLEGFIPEKVDELLELKEKNLKSVLMLPVGIRASDDFMQRMKKVRRPLDEMVIDL